MKLTFMHILSVIILLWSCADASVQGQIDDREIAASSSYDSLLAQELGADAYGMKTYVMAFLKEGPNRDQDSTTAATIQRGHLDNITRMAKAGKLVFAGPFLDNFEIKGIYIFDVETIEEAQQLTQTDPAIKSGRLEMELHPFYGSAALIKVNEIHERTAREEI